MSIRIVLWDVDGTLLDFDAAERVAIRKGFERHHLGTCTDEMLARYNGINKKYWDMLAKDLLTKPEVLVKRFEEFFTAYGLDPQKAIAFNENYQEDLGDTAVLYADAMETIRALKGRVIQCAATNGTITAARKKLKNSGLDREFDEIFISDELGHEKPHVEFFDIAFAALREKFGGFTPDEVLIVGDSPSSDIRGGLNAGIHTCLFNPLGEEKDPETRAEYEIRALKEVPELLTRI